MWAVGFGVVLLSPSDHNPTQRARLPVRTPIEPANAGSDASPRPYLGRFSVPCDRIPAEILVTSVPSDPASPEWRYGTPGAAARLRDFRGKSAGQRPAGVGASPIAGFIFGDDRYGITLNSVARTASVIDLDSMSLADTLMLDGVPRSGALSPDRKMLFVTMGGDTYPPAGANVTVIAGDPPRVVTSLATGRGATAVAVSPDGTRAAVACWSDKSITIFEQEATPPPDSAPPE